MFKSGADKKRLKYLMNLNKDRSSHLRLINLKLLEDTKLLDNSIKIEILEMIAGFRLLSEIVPNINEIQSTKSLLNKLKIPNYKSEHESKRNNMTFTYFQIATNQTTLSFFKRFEQELGSIELGIMYGYHPKSILAFIGLIKSRVYGDIKYAYQYFDQKVLSVDFFKEEDDYHKMKWNTIKVISPKIIKDAENEFRLQLSDKTPRV